LNTVGLTFYEIRRNEAFQVMSCWYANIENEMQPVLNLKVSPRLRYSVWEEKMCEKLNKESEGFQILWCARRLIFNLSY